MAYYDAAGKTVTTSVGQALLAKGLTGFVSYDQLLDLFQRASELWPGETLKVFSIGSTGITYAIDEKTASPKRHKKKPAKKHK